MVQVPGQQMGGGRDNFMANLTKAAVLFVGIPFAISRTLVQGTVGIIRTDPKTVRPVARYVAERIAYRSTRTSTWLAYNAYVERGDLAALIKGEPLEIGWSIAVRPVRVNILLGVLPIPFPWVDLRSRTDATWKVNIPHKDDNTQSPSEPTQSSQQSNDSGAGTKFEPSDYWRRRTSIQTGQGSSSDPSVFIKRYYAAKSRRRIWCSIHNKSDYCFRRKRNR